MATKSLHGFCKEHNLPKSSVHEYLREQGFETSNGVDDEAQKALASRFELKLEHEEVKQVLEATVEVGNHCVTLAAPDLSGGRSLEPLRDSETMVFEDPLAIATQFQTLSKSIIQGMDSDIVQREARLKEARDAQRQVQEAAQELQLEVRMYRDRAHRIDAEQTDTTEQIKKSVEELQRLGKQKS